MVIALAGFGAWLVFAIYTWAGAAPLGHDESQYAIATRAALDGEPVRWFYLSRGMLVIGAPGIWLGETERALRLFPLVIGVGFVAATWLFARRTVGAISAYAVRDYTPRWASAPQPVFTELPGKIQILLVRPVEVEVARFDPP